MKDRLHALDGLRGFASFAVMLSHTGFNMQTITSIPLFTAAYKTLGVGPNSVQILFVLCGFFMAFLYPVVKHTPSFLQKRYTRIIPIYALIVTALAIISSAKLIFWYQQAAVFCILIVVFHVAWKCLQKYDTTGKFGRAIFCTFILLQIISALFNFFILPHFVQNTILTLPSVVRDLVIFISNLTLTTQFARELPQLSGVFWSLAPEVLFYVLYPILIIPLVQLGKKYGAFISIALIAGITKILFDLDETILSFESFGSLNISRASGFAVGVIIGSLYQSKNDFWKFIEKICSYKLVNILIFLLFIAVQWGDWAIRDGKSHEFMNLYYLFSNWVFGLVVIAAIIPHSFVHAIFNNRILKYLGFISYSLYLTHIEVIEWSRQIMTLAKPFISNVALFEIFSLIFMVILNIAFSSVLFRYIESLYFAGKKKGKDTYSLAVQENVEKKPLQQFKYFPLATGFFLWIVFILIIYSGNFAPTLFVSRHSFPQTAVNELALQNQHVSIPITATHNNLGMIIMKLRYTKNAEFTRVNDKKPAQLFFKLYDEKKQTVLFETQKDAFTVAGEPFFPFGLPPIADSAGKNYIIEIKQTDGNKDDQVLIDTSSTSIISAYQSSQSEIIKNPLTFVLNRLLFIFSNPKAVFAVSFALMVIHGLVHIKRKHI